MTKEIVKVLISFYFMLLLIDNRTPNIQHILHFLESHVTPVIFDFWEETFDSLASKIPEKRYRHLGILQETINLQHYCLLNSFGESILKDVEILDPNLESWTSFHLFIELCISRLDILTVDLINYEYSKDWEYVSQEWNIPIRYSNKYYREISFQESPLNYAYFKKKNNLSKINPKNHLLQNNYDSLNIDISLYDKIMNNKKKNETTEKNGLSIHPTINRQNMWMNPFIESIPIVKSSIPSIHSSIMNKLFGSTISSYT